MKPNSELTLSAASRPMALARALVCGTALAVGLAGCKHGEEHAQVAGWTLVDPTERHPILVSQQPQTMNVHVSKGAGGLTAQQRAELLSFAGRARAADAGNSRLVIAAPSGAANEVAAMRAVHEIRAMLVDNGFSEADVSVEVYSQEGRAQPPVRVSYMRYVAEAPQCHQWTTNLAHEPQNLPYPNMGCATQQNLAAMIANPADLLGPRGETDRDSERRDVAYEKYVKGDTTGAKKSGDEKISTDGGG